MGEPVLRIETNAEIAVVDAERAEAWGIVNRVVPSNELVPTAVSLAADMLSCGRTQSAG